MHTKQQKQNKMTTLQSIIHNLKPGYSETISECNGIKVTAERSGDGKTLRFVRHSNNGNTINVFKTCKY